MKKVYSMLSIFAVVFVLCIIQVSAEVILFQDTFIDRNQSLVTQHAYYQLQDTSINLITIIKPVKIKLSNQVQSLPYNISAVYPQYPNALIDWCNYTIVQQKNIYDTTLGLTTQGNYNILNTTYERTNIFYQNINATGNITDLELRARDGVVVDMTCHYTDPNTLFIDNVYFGSISAYIPAFECLGCSSHTFEEVTKVNDAYLANLQQSNKLFTYTQSLLDKNVFIIGVIVWIIKIALIFLALGMIFMFFRYLYIFVKRVGT